jgi:hypothetical protein
VVTCSLVSHMKGGIAANGDGNPFAVNQHVLIVKLYSEVSKRVTAYPVLTVLRGTFLALLFMMIYFSSSSSSLSFPYIVTVILNMTIMTITAVQPSVQFISPSYDGSSSPPERSCLENRNLFITERMSCRTKESPSSSNLILSR